MRRLNIHCESGQLLLPMLGLLFMFGLFLAGYVRWCQRHYWTLRMDIAARATALSAARHQAAMLNTMATLQLAENLFLQKATLPLANEDFGHMQIALRIPFETLNGLLNLRAKSFAGDTQRIATLVAKANGANKIPIPIGTLSHKLKPQKVRVGYFLYFKYLYKSTYNSAYFVRSWQPKETRAQPDHRLGWIVCHDDVRINAWTKLWLDVDPQYDPFHLSNGGFPREIQSVWRGVGIQCGYPQFNARLMARKGQFG